MVLRRAFISEHTGIRFVGIGPFEHIAGIKVHVLPSKKPGRKEWKKGDLEGEFYCILAF